MLLEVRPRYLISPRSERAGYSSGTSAMQSRLPAIPRLLSCKNLSERGRGWKYDVGQATPPLRPRHNCSNGPNAPRSMITSAPRQTAGIPPPMADSMKLPGTLPTIPVAQRTSTDTRGNKNFDPIHKTKDTNSVLKKVQMPPTMSLAISAADAPRPVTLFPSSRESVIYLTLLGEVITCDLKTLGSDPAAIIELLKVTQSERGSYVIVAAYYRRSGLPGSARLVMQAVLQESRKRDVPDSDLKAVYLLLAGCETDLAKLAKTEKKDPRVVSAHYDSATLWLQKVFGTIPVHASEDDKENRPPEQKEQNTTPNNSKEFKILEREIHCLRDKNAQQADQLAQLRSSKRKIEDDYYYERNLRRKYQSRVESFQEERGRYKLEQGKREGSKGKMEDKVCA